MKMMSIVVLFLLLASMTYAMTYNITGGSGLKLGAPFNHTPVSAPRIIITFGNLEHVNVTSKGVTQRPSYGIPSYTKPLFNGSCSSCYGECIPKQKNNPSLGYVCRKLSPTGFDGYVITAGRIVKVK